MKHPGYFAGCRACEINAGEQPSPGGGGFESGLWLIRHAPPPYGVPGWMLMQDLSGTYSLADAM